MPIILSTGPLQLIQRKSLALPVVLMSLWLLPTMALASGQFVVTTTAMMSVPVSTMARPDAGVESGIDAPAIDSQELARQHGRGATSKTAKGTNSLAVILWDERGGKGGQTTRVSLTGTGNVQSSTVRVNRR